MNGFINSALYLRLWQAMLFRWDILFFTVLFNIQLLILLCNSLAQTVFRPRLNNVKGSTRSRSPWLSTWKNQSTPRIPQVISQASSQNFPLNLHAKAREVVNMPPDGGPHLSNFIHLQNEGEYWSLFGVATGGRAYWSSKEPLFARFDQHVMVI